MNDRPRTPPVPFELDEQGAQVRRDAPGRLVHATYRLVKACALHSDANQAVQALVPPVSAAVAEVCAFSGADAATILFGGEFVLVNRKMVRTSRETYAHARELAGLLEHLGINEIAFDRSVRAQEIAQFARVVVDAQRTPALAQPLRADRLPGVHARKVRTDETAVRLEADTPIARLVRAYAASIVILRSLHADLAAGKLEIGHRVKRVAQKLTIHAQHDGRLLVALATAPLPPGDPAAMAVSTASIAALMARHLTEDPAALAAIALAALVLDVGRARLRDAPERDAASTALVLLAIGRLQPQAVIRTVVTFEALATVRVAGGSEEAPAITPHAAIVATARAFNEARAGAGGAPMTVSDAVDVLMAEAPGDHERFYVQLLVRALGLFPTAGLVELNTGELAVVMGAPELLLDFARPPVRILSGPAGEDLDPPLDLDLAAPRRPGQPLRFIRRAVLLDAPEASALRSAL